MTKRKWLLLVLSVAACVGLLALHPLTRRKDHITELDIRRIAIGMSETDVERILGVPAGIYNSTAPPAVLALPQDAHCKSWVGDGWAAVVSFDQAGRVAKVDPCAFEKETTLRRTAVLQCRFWVDRVFDKLYD